MKRDDNPKVSIIVPVYNIKPHLRASLQSIISQSYRNLEIIIVDDGSTDGSYEISKEYSLVDARISLVKQQNSGVSSARNNALSRVTGDFYIFIDGDDIVRVNHVESLLRVALHNNSDIVCAGVKIVYNDTVDVSATTEGGSVKKVDPYTAINMQLYLKGIENYVVAKIYKTSVHKSLRFNEKLRIGEDMVYVFDALRASKNITLHLSESYYYLQRKGSAMNNHFAEKRSDSLLAAELILRNAKDNASILNAANTKLFSEAVTVLAEVYPHKAMHPGIYQKCKKISLELAVATVSNREARLVTRGYAVLRLISVKLLSYVANYRRQQINRRANV